MTDLTKRCERLRGKLTHKRSIGSREIEKAARNLSCDRLQGLTLAGLTPQLALTEVYGEKDMEGQSPFAISSGERFESFLSKDNGAALVSLYVKEGRLGRDAQVVNLKERYPGKSNGAIEQRVQATREFIEQERVGKKCPDLILFPRLELKIPSQTVRVEPDALVLDDKGYRVVEIKSYADRRGKTDQAKIRGACRQAAVSSYALDQVMKDLGSTVTAPKAVCDLILRKPGSFTPTLRSMTLEGEHLAVEMLFQQFETRLNEIEFQIEAGASLDKQSTLNQLPINYQSDCREFCALSSVCRGQACAKSDPAFLGGKATEELNSVRTIDRALELLHGIGVGPKNAEEAALKLRLQKAHKNYRKAVGYGV